MYLLDVRNALHVTTDELRMDSLQRQETLTILDFWVAVLNSGG